jgi:hypothetical protein
MNQLNIKDISVRGDVVVVIAVQETHTSSDVNLHQRGETPRYRLIGAVYMASEHLPKNH